VQLIGELLAQSAGIDVERLHQIADRGPPFQLFLLGGDRLSRIGATSTLAIGAAVDPGAGAEPGAVVSEPPERWRCPGLAASALVPKIALMIFTEKWLIVFAPN